MPSTCCVMGCNKKTSYFGFPKNPELVRKWLEAIERKDFTPSKYSRVCILHFNEEDILRTTTAVNAESGVALVAKNPKISLREDAVPISQAGHWKVKIKTYIQNKKGDGSEQEDSPEECETLIESPQNKAENAVLEKQSLKRKSRKLDRSDSHEKPKRKIQKHTNDNISEQAGEHEGELAQKECEAVTSYSNFKEFLNVIQKMQSLPNDWQLVIEQHKVNLLKLVCSPGPVVSFAITISYSLTVQTYFYGQEIDYFNTPFVTSDITDLTLLLEKIDLTQEQPVDLTYITTLLEPYGLSFLSEQLKLHASIKQGCRYSCNTLIGSALIFLKSPSAYSLIKQLGLILPHPTTLDSFFISKNYFTNHESGSVNLCYATNLFDTLEDKNKTVILHLDQLVLLDSNLNIFIFSLSSPTTTLREIVCITNHENGSLDPKKLHSLTSSIILNLEEIGYKIVCIVTGFNSLILQAMAKFTLDDKWGSTYPHPSNPQRQLYHIFDAVLLLKTFLAQLFALSGIDYPNLESHQKRYASIKYLRLMQDFNDKKMLDLSLNYNIVASLESFMLRPSMSGFSKIFNHDISNQFFNLSTSDDNFKHTGEFINLFVRLWEIIGVETPPENNICPPDGFGYPLMANTDFDTDRKIQFLRAMTSWFNTYKCWKFSDLNMKLEVELLRHTIQGLLDLSKFCLETLKLEYVLLGSFHSFLDAQFAKYHVYLP